MRMTLLGAALALSACAAGFDDSSESAGDFGAEPRGSGVGQSGAQDFGRFRGIIEDGELPAPNTLDAVGFFNEHKIELPAPDCGDDVCLHSLLGVQGNMINGNNCTIAVVGFNTPRTPDEYERPPLNMAIAVDTSGSMAGQPIEAVRAGLRALVETADVKDTIALIAYSDEAELVVDSTPESDPDRQLLSNAIEELVASGGTNIYAGLRDALEIVDGRRDSARQNRVIMLSDGEATAGITDGDRIVNLGQSYASDGIGITTIGVGREFDIDLMRGLSEAGAGNFYFLEDVAAVEEVFSEEVKTFLVPLAEDVTIDFDVAEGYSFRALYGTRLWTGDSGGATIQIPSLFMASRESIDDIDPGGGRRGGGGVILLELTPNVSGAAADEIGPNAPVGNLQMSYAIPNSEVSVEQSMSIINELKPGETPAEGDFDNFAVEKSFVALNIYAGFEMAIERANAGASNAALNVLLPLEERVTAWERDNDDPDIEDDLRTMRQLIDIIEETGARETVGAPPDPWPRD